MTKSNFNRPGRIRLGEQVLGREGEGDLWLTLLFLGVVGLHTCVFGAGRGGGLLLHCTTSRLVLE